MHLMLCCLTALRQQRCKLAVELAAEAALAVELAVELAALAALALELAVLCREEVLRLAAAVGEREVLKLDNETNKG
jgi:hypothetical protein